jgi:hypothetical protein
MNDQIRRAAAIVLVTAALTQIAACASTPREQSPSDGLPHWSGPEDCTTASMPAASSLAADRGSAPALLVDSAGAGWNCVAIPEGRYDMSVAARGANSTADVVLEAKDIIVVPGRRLVAKAHQSGSHRVPAFFFQVTARPEPAAAMGGGAAQQSSSGHGAAKRPLHPAILVPLAVVAAPFGAAYFIAMAPFAVAGALLKPATTRLYGPDPGRCFVWIEDGLAGEVIAGERPRGS